MKSNSGAMSLFLGLLLYVAANIGSGPSVVWAQNNYPAKTIYMICSSAAGGTSDLIFACARRAALRTASSISDC